MITATLAEMIRAVEFGASIRGQIGAGNTFRHPTDDVIAEINSAYGEFQELLVDCDFDFFLVETALANLPTTRADTAENYSLIDWPATALVIKRVDVFVDNCWDPLEKLDWAQLRLPLPRTGNRVCRRPEYFSAKSFGTVTGATTSAGKIALAPFATKGQFKVSYLPQWPGITDTTFKFIFPSETGKRWCVWNTIARISIRDEDPGRRYDKSLKERQICEDRIGKFSAQTIATGPTRMMRSKHYNGR